VADATGANATALADPTALSVWFWDNVLYDKAFLHTLMQVIFMVYIVGIATGMALGWLASRACRRTPPATQGPSSIMLPEIPAPSAPPAEHVQTDECEPGNVDGEPTVPATPQEPVAPLPPPPSPPASSYSRVRAVEKLWWSSSGDADLRFHLRRDCSYLKCARRVHGHSPCTGCIGKTLNLAVD